MKSYYIFLLMGLFLTGLVKETLGQDPHLSQYFASPVWLNPASTGMEKDGSYRTAAHFRSQWGAVATQPYVTTTLSFDMPLKERWGIGGFIMNNDEPRVMNVFSGVLTGGYQIMDPSQKEHWLSAGLRLGVINKTTRRNELVFDRQYTGSGNFDPNQPHGEDLSQERKWMPEIGAGIRYKMTNDEKTLNPRGGFSVYHITAPDESFTSTGESRLPRRYVFHGGVLFHVSEAFKVDPGFLVMKQGEAMEYDVGADFSYEFSGNQATRAHLGGYYRVGDAVVAMAGVYYQQMMFRMSYDFNVSSLKAYSGGNGGWEFSVLYKLNREK